MRERNVYLLEVAKLIVFDGSTYQHVLVWMNWVEDFNLSILSKPTCFVRQFDRPIYRPTYLNLFLKKVKN